MKNFIIASLPKKQLFVAMSAADRGNRIICGQIDLGNRCFRMYTADGTMIDGPLKMFEPSGDGTKPDFQKFKLDDFGYTICFGDYEAASDALT